MARLLRAQALRGTGTTTAGVAIARNERMFIPKGSSVEAPGADGAPRVFDWSDTLFWNVYYVKGAFLDADKQNYGAYYEKLLLLLRAGGLVAVDNTLALSGEPIIEQQTASARALRAFNDFVRADERVDLAMLTIGEGLTLLRKRG